MGTTLSRQNLSAKRSTHCENSRAVHISLHNSRTVTDSLANRKRQSNCSAISYLSNAINILAGDDPVPVKFGPKGTDPNRKDACFTFHRCGALCSRR